MKPIVRVPNTVLTTQAQTIIQFNKKLTDLIAELKETLAATKNPKGVGLAAPQIGVGWRAFITKPLAKSDIRVFINPEIIASSVELVDGIPESKSKLEGCLSIPKVWGKVKRHRTVTLKYQDETGAEKTETFDGFPAIIIQHETDHTNGTLFTQRVLEQRGPLYQATTDKEGKEVLEEIHI